MFLKMRILLFIKKYYIPIILLLILFFHFINNLLWLKLDNSLKSCDASGHLLKTVQYHIYIKNIIKSHPSFLGLIKELFSLFRMKYEISWPPLIYFLSFFISPLYFDIFTIRLYVNFLFYFILIISVYFLGKKCFNKRVGVFASFIVSFYPEIYGYSRQFGLDFPLAAMTSLCLCLLIYSDYFSRPFFSFFFGIALGVATLVKFEITFFLGFPLLYVVYKIISEKKKNNRNICLINLLGSIFISFLFFFFYWANKINLASQHFL